MKVLTTVAVLALSLSVTAYHNQSNPQHHEQDVKHPPAPTTAVISNPTTSPAQQSADNELCKRLLDALVVNWPLILVGIGGIWIALRALKPSEDAAHAALLNAQAVINTERAWLTVVIADELAALPNTARNRVENERRQIRRVMAERISGEENGEGYMCYISIQNQGRTPAKIVGGSSAHCFIDRPDNLPIPPDYSTPFFLPDSTFIVTGDSFKIHPGFKPDFILERTGKRGAVDGALEFLIFFGCVVYEDVFALPDGTSGTHETRWCFAYRPSGDKPSLNSMFLSPTEQPRPAAFVTCGPPEYSGHKENKSQ